MSATTYPFQGPVNQLLVNDYIQTTTATALSTYATMFTQNAAQKAILGTIRLRAFSGQTCGTEILTFRILRADGSTTATLAATVALNTAQGTAGAFGAGALTSELCYSLPSGVGGLGTAFTVNYVLQPGDSVQVAQTVNGTAANKYHIDVTGFILP